MREVKTTCAASVGQANLAQEGEQQRNPGADTAREAQSEPEKHLAAEELDRLRRYLKRTYRLYATVWIIGLLATFAVAIGCYVFGAQSGDGILKYAGYSVALLAAVALVLTGRKIRRSRSAVRMISDVALERAWHCALDNYFGDLVHDIIIDDGDANCAISSWESIPSPLRCVSSNNILLLKEAENQARYQLPRSGDRAQLFFSMTAGIHRGLCGLRVELSEEEYDMVQAILPDFAYYVHTGCRSV